MKVLFFANYHLVFLNCIALLLFMAIFVGAIIWVTRRSQQELYEYMKSLPLGDDV